MNPGAAARDLDLTAEQVRLLLAQQGFAIPEVELLEVTASLNALVEGLTHLEGYGTLQNEPWPTLVGYLDGTAAAPDATPGGGSRPDPEAGHA